MARRSFLPVRATVTDMPRSKTPETTRMKAMRSRCRGFMLAWILKMKPEKSGWWGSRDPSIATRGRGGGARRSRCSRNGPTPKLVIAEPKKNGVTSPARKSSTLHSSPASATNSSSSKNSSSTSGSTWSFRVGSSRSRITSGASSVPPTTRWNRCTRWVERSNTPRKRSPEPMGQFIGTVRMSKVLAISSSSSSGSRAGRSHLLTKVSTGRRRRRHTSNRRRVRGSTPLAPSMSMTAESTADSVR